MLAHKPHPKSVWKPANQVWLTSHGRPEHIGISDHSSTFGVSTAEHGSFIDICGSYDRYSVINYHAFGMDVQLFRDKLLRRTYLPPGSQTKEVNIIFRLNTLGTQPTTD